MLLTSTHPEINPIQSCPSIYSRCSATSICDGILFVSVLTNFGQDSLHTRNLTSLAGLVFGAPAFFRRCKMSEFSKGKKCQGNVLKLTSVTFCNPVCWHAVALPQNLLKRSLKKAAAHRIPSQSKHLSGIKILVSPVAVVSRQELEVDLQLSEAISLGRSEPVQGVGGDRVEGGGEGHLGGGAGGQENPTVAHDGHVEVVGQGNLEAFL